MSNAIAGAIYKEIIDKVISTSEHDFEELGVDRKTLEEMKEIWKTKLSELHIAHLPWDPQPAPAQIANPPTVPSNVKKEDPSPAPAQGPSSESQTPQSAAPTEANDVKYAPQIKTEPGYESPVPNYPQVNGGPHGLNPQLAQQRAAGLLQDRFGSQAQASIAAGMQQQQQQPGGGLALPGQARPHGLQLPGQRPQQRPPGQGFPPQQVQASQQQQQQRSSLGNAQTDGGADDDEDDADAINSDLDDSDEDDLQQQENDDANVSQVMVCLYDKVARVRNRWKCTLKDGILTTNGKDYIFHKATGEFEW